MKILIRTTLCIFILIILTINVYGFSKIEFEILNSPSGDNTIFNFEFKINVFDERANDTVIVVLDAGLETEVGFKTELNRGKQSRVLQYVNPSGNIPSTVSLVISDSYYFDKVPFETASSGIITVDNMQKSPYNGSLDSAVVGNRIAESNENSPKTSVPKTAVTTATSATNVPDEEISNDIQPTEDENTSAPTSERLDAAGDYSQVPTVTKLIIALSAVLIIAFILPRKGGK